MSELPERIFAVKGDTEWRGFWLDGKHPNDNAIEYLRADLAPALVGYSREEVVGAMEDLGMWVHDSTPSWNDIGVQIEKIVSTITPAAKSEQDQRIADTEARIKRVLEKTASAVKVPDPRGLVEALERIANPLTVNSDYMMFVAREALAAYRKGGKE
jgi:hypothetical protein